MLHPLIFRNSFRNIQNIKKKCAAHKMLRPSSVQSFALSTFPPGGRLNQRQSFKKSNILQQSATKRAMPAPRGEAYVKGNHLKFLTFCNCLLRKRCCPSSVGFADSFPPRGSLCQRQSFKISNEFQQSVTRRAMPAPGGKPMSKANSIGKAQLKLFNLKRRGAFSDSKASPNL